MDREFKVGTLVRVVEVDEVDVPMGIMVGMKGYIKELDPEDDGMPRCHEVVLLVPGTNMGFTSYLYEKQMEVLGHVSDY